MQLVLNMTINGGTYCVCNYDKCIETIQKAQYWLGEETGLG